MINCMVGSKRPQSLEPVCSRTPHTLILSLYALHLVLIYPHLILICHPSCPYMPSILSLYCTVHIQSTWSHTMEHTKDNTQVYVSVCGTQQWMGGWCVSGGGLRSYLSECLSSRAHFLEQYIFLSLGRKGFSTRDLPQRLHLKHLLSPCHVMLLCTSLDCSKDMVIPQASHTVENMRS